MRVCVKGNSPSVAAVASGLKLEGFYVDSEHPTHTIELNSVEGPIPIIDGVDGLFEQQVLLQLEAFFPVLMLKRQGGNRSPFNIVIGVPAHNAHHLENSIVRAVCAFTNARAVEKEGVEAALETSVPAVRRGFLRGLFGATIVLMLVSLAYGQKPSPKPVKLPPTISHEDKIELRNLQMRAFRALVAKLENELALQQANSEIERLEAKIRAKLGAPVSQFRLTPELGWEAQPVLEVVDKK